MSPQFSSLDNDMLELCAGGYGGGYGGGDFGGDPGPSADPFEGADPFGGADFGGADFGGDLGGDLSGDLGGDLGGDLDLSGDLGGDLDLSGDLGGDIVDGGDLGGSDLGDDDLGGAGTWANKPGTGGSGFDATMDAFWGQVDQAIGNFKDFVENPVPLLNERQTLEQGACMVAGYAGGLVGTFLSGFTGPLMPVTTPLFSWAGNSLANAACMAQTGENGTYDLGGAMISDIVAP